MQYMKDHHRNNYYESGMAGEEAAASYLISEGYEILARNYRYQKAEIDILALCENSLAVVEVKTRTIRFYECLSECISKPKIRRIVMAADHFIRERRLEVEVRFDIIQLEGKTGAYRITHIKDAFYYF